MNQRYTALYLAVFFMVLSLINLAVTGSGLFTLILFLGLSFVGFYDITQEKKAILKNYPIIGHLRYFFEYIRPEIRQYFIESNTESAPFSRNQRSLVYQRSKEQIDKVPFGSQLDFKKDGYAWLTHSLNPSSLSTHDFRITIGGPACQNPYHASVFNISALSFGAISAKAIESLNRGAAKGHFYQDTGEGGISPYHLKGGDIVWEIGSGYFGCRDESGLFSKEKFSSLATLDQVKMIEIKLSQGAKPGHGGILPGKKVTNEIAKARGVKPLQDCISPAKHQAFSNPIELLQFIQELRDISNGKPVGIKLCIGKINEWFSIVKAMLKVGITPDFIVIDGAEGGTGAAPLEFIDHVGMSVRDAIHLVHNSLIGVQLRDRIKLGCAGKVISAFDICYMLALGADWCNSARGFMFSLGCIQSMSCHTDKCPTGIATQDPLRQEGLTITDKEERVFHYHQNTLIALKELIEASGLTSLSEITKDLIFEKNGDSVQSLSEKYPTLEPGSLLTGKVSSLPSWWRLNWEKASEEQFL